MSDLEIVFGNEVLHLCCVTREETLTLYYCVQKLMGPATGFITFPQLEEQ